MAKETPKKPAAKTTAAKPATAPAAKPKAQSGGTAVKTPLTAPGKPRPAK